MLLLLPSQSTAQNPLQTIAEGIQNTLSGNESRTVVDCPSDQAVSYFQGVDLQYSVKLDLRVAMSDIVVGEARIVDITTREFYFKSRRLLGDIIACLPNWKTSVHELGVLLDDVIFELQKIENKSEYGEVQLEIDELIRVQIQVKGYNDVVGNTSLTVSSPTSSSMVEIYSSGGWQVEVGDSYTTAILQEGAPPSRQSFGTLDISCIDSTLSYGLYLNGVTFEDQLYRVTLNDGIRDYQVNMEGYDVDLLLWDELAYDAIDALRRVSYLGVTVHAPEGDYALEFHFQQPTDELVDTVFRSCGY